VERFDAIVVGAGPAGSTTAYRLATAGARVLLLDRARFPRDKPCGGGLTARAVRELPFAVDAVVEDRATRVTIRAGYRGGFERRSREPLVLLTERLRLDAFLAERAAGAGADFRDGVRVTEPAASDAEVSVRLDGREVHAAVLIGADGANGIVARTLGLAREVEHGVALEGSVAGAEDRFRGLLALEFGVVPGGYGWVFPKGDHVNVGVGGWSGEGPRLRGHLRRLCDAHGLSWERVESLRGHRLPMRRLGARLARGRVAVVGDAAGLVDPFSGDGIFEALVSARLASAAVLELLEGRAASLDPYDDALTRRLARLTSFSWGLKTAVDRFPRLSLAAVRLPPAWPVIEAIVRGDLDDVGSVRGPARASTRVLGALARRSGDAGRAFRAA
jgi:geranylgeranyl reductase family protein